MANKTKLEKLATVNIIEMKQGTLHSIRSFNDNPKGNEQAEKTFKALVNKHHSDEQGSGNGASIGNEDMEIFLDNGIYDEQDGYVVMICHSTPESI